MLSHSGFPKGNQIIKPFCQWISSLSLQKWAQSQLPFVSCPVLASTFS